jgi:alkylation response protein AidB-like acyl-CoA dehydrogenase
MLPKLASGEAVFTAAVAEEDGDFWAEGVQMRAERQGSEYVLSGTKSFVPDAKAADYILVAARTGPRGGDPEDGITLFLVDTSEWGVYVAPLETMDQTRKQYELQLTRLAVPDKYIVGEVGKGWPILERAALRMTAALCADAVGGGEWVLETTVNYVKDRIQFGVAIGSFQSIKHKVADMYSALEYSRSLMEWAAESVREEADNAATAVAMAKSFGGESYRLITDHGVQCHGGIGFTWDHDMHLYFKRARHFDAAFGDSTHQREMIAQSFD